MRHAEWTKDTEGVACGFGQVTCRVNPVTGAGPEFVYVAVMSVCAGVPGGLAKPKATVMPSFWNTVTDGIAPGAPDPAAGPAGAPNPRDASGSAPLDDAAGAGPPRFSISCARRRVVVGKGVRLFMKRLPYVT